MLLVIAPRAYVLRAIGPHEGALAILLSILKVSLVLATVIPELDAAALNRALLELTLIDLVHICEIVLAMSLELAVDEISFVVGAISPLKAALALLLTLEELA
jgi:hypothetical protein